MQQSRFMVLAGHLNDYPLAELVGILRHQQKTGRLLIEYSKGPAMFFFKDGELIDVQMTKLNGLQALCVALAQEPASFNFNPLIQPTKRSIEKSFQKAVSELLGCWDENALEIEKVEPAISLPRPEQQQLPAPSVAALPPADTDNNADVSMPQAIALASVDRQMTRRRYSPSVMTMAAAGVLMLGVSAFIGVSGEFGSEASSTPTSSPVAAVNSERFQAASIYVEGKVVARGSSRLLRENGRNAQRQHQSVAGSKDVLNESPSANQRNSNVETKPNSTDARSVQVIVQVENGRVAKASIGNHKPGMDAYEALALRIARQRRYASKTSNQETITIKVDRPK